MMNIPVGSYIMIEIAEMKGNPWTGNAQVEKLRVPRKVIASHGTSFTIELPDGGLKEIHEYAIKEVKAPGWNPEHLGPVVKI